MFRLSFVADFINNISSCIRFKSYLEELFFTLFNHELLLKPCTKILFVKKCVKFDIKVVLTLYTKAHGMYYTRRELYSYHNIVAGYR